MGEQKYAVVSFINEEDAGDEEIVSEVPFSWLTTDKTQCWWPKIKNVNAWILKSTPPNPDDPKWDLHSIECQGIYGSLEVARKRAENVYSSSDEKEKTSRARRKLVKGTIVPIQDSDTSDEDSRASILSKPPVFPCLIPLPEASCSTYSNSSPQKCDSNTGLSKILGSQPMIDKPTIPSKPQILSDIRISSPGAKDVCTNSLKKRNRAIDTSAADSFNDILLDDIPIMFNHDSVLLERANKAMEDNFHRVFTALTTMSIDLRILSEQITKIEQLMSRTNKAPGADLIAQFSTVFPFKSKEDILIFDANVMKEPKLLENTVKYPSQIGGSTAKENIIRILRIVFTNSLAQKSSWLGLRNNFKISGTKLIDAVKGAVLLRFSITDQDFEEIASEWLRQASQRLKRKEKKAQGN